MALNEVLLLSLMVRWFDEGLMSVRKPSSVFDCFWFQNGAYKLNELWRPDLKIPQILDQQFHTKKKINFLLSLANKKYENCRHLVT